MSRGVRGAAGCTRSPFSAACSSGVHVAIVLIIPFLASVAGHGLGKLPGVRNVLSTIAQMIIPLREPGTGMRNVAGGRSACGHPGLHTRAVEIRPLTLP